MLESLCLLVDKTMQRLNALLFQSSRVMGLILVLLLDGFSSIKTQINHPASFFCGDEFCVLIHALLFLRLGPKAAELLKKDGQYISPSYRRYYPLVVESAKDCVVETLTATST